MPRRPDPPRRNASGDLPAPPANGEARNGTVVKSASRTLQILDFFDEIQREARLSEIAAALGSPPSSTSMLLRSLVEHGYLHYDRRRRTYLLTTRVALLGSWIPNAAVQGGQVSRLMEHLGQITGHAVSLACRNGIYAQYIHMVHATNVLRMAVPVGTRRILTWSSLGFCLLVDAEEEEILALVKRTNAEAPPGQASIDPQKVLQRIADLRAEGHVFSTGLITPGAGMVAMPLPRSGGAAAQSLAIGISGWSEVIASEKDQIVELMHDAIRRHLPTEDMPPDGTD